jgi:clorobiocin/coumermycin A biosynthesis protein CloN6/CouN6
MMLPKSNPVLYIHPKSQLMFKEIIPHSIPALMNQIDYPVLGRYEEELNEREVKQAQIAIIDIHWYLTLPSAFKLSFRLKKINPSLIIIAGGITASIYAKQIVKHTAIDYVIRGDAEEPLPQLVEQILNKGNPQKVSNIVHRDFVSDWNFAVTQEILDKLNYTNYDFFPSFQKGIYRFHSYKGGRPFATHPICIPLRGCPSFCNDCMGSINNQQILFNRKPVRKSNHRVKDELMEISNHPNLHYVNFYHDFLANAPESYYKNILNTHYNLNLYYEFKKTPDKEQLQALMGAFNGGILCFPIGEATLKSLFCEKCPP